MHMPIFGKSLDQASVVKELNVEGEQLLEKNNFINKGRIVDAKALQQKQKLAIMPFKAGANVEASDELDRVALMIIKGISDAFLRSQDGNHGHFQILTAENFSEADLIVRGHITDLISPSKIRRLLPLKAKKTLGVAGKILKSETGEVVLIFNDREASDDTQDDYSQIGYRIGKNIGEFILSGLSQ